MSIGNRCDEAICTLVLYAQNVKVSTVKFAVLSSDMNYPNFGIFDYIQWKTDICMDRTFSSEQLKWYFNDRWCVLNPNEFILWTKCEW